MSVVSNKKVRWIAIAVATAAIVALATILINNAVAATPDPPLRTHAQVVQQGNAAMAKLPAKVRARVAQAPTIGIPVSPCLARGLSGDSCRRFLGRWIDRAHLTGTERACAIGLGVAVVASTAGWIVAPASITAIVSGAVSGSIGTCLNNAINRAINSQ